MSFVGIGSVSSDSEHSIETLEELPALIESFGD
jgi:hypothetical protein